MDGFKSGSLQSNGIEIHYVEKGEGPLVIFCHGWPESWYSWRHQIREIGSKGYRAVALHMRGYGKTTKPEDIEAYNITNLVGDVVGAVTELGASEAVVVGHDWGSIVGWALISRGNINVKKYISILFGIIWNRFFGFL